MSPLKLVQLTEKGHSIFVTVAEEDVSALLQFTYKHVRESAIVSNLPKASKVENGHIPLKPASKDTPVPLTIKRLAAKMCKMAALKNKKCCKVSDFYERASQELG